MTTIAFDGKVLAVDSGLTTNGMLVRHPTPKILVGANRAAAMTGSVSDVLALARWWVDGSVGPCPTGIDAGDSLLGIERGRPLAIYVNNLGRELEMGTPDTEGSGAQVAMGALLAGALATEAVRIACEVDKGTLGPVNYVIAAEDPWVIRQVPDRPAAWDGTYTFPVRREGDGLDEVRLASRANGGSAPHSPHEGNA